MKGTEMSIKKLASVAVGGALLATALAACGSNNDSASGGPAADCTPKASFPTLKKGTLTVGVYIEPPYTTPGSGGTLKGVDGEILDQIAADACLTLKTTEMAAPALFQNIESKRLDAGVGALSINDERKKIYDYAGPLYYTQLSYVSKDDVKTAGDLQGKTIGVVAGYRWNPEYQRKFGDKVKVYQSNDGLLNDLMAGRVNVGLYDVGDIEYALQKVGKGSDFHINVAPPDSSLPTTQSPGQTVVLLPKGSTEAVDAMNATIDAMRKSGKLSQIIESNGLPEASEIK